MKRVVLGVFCLMFNITAYAGQWSVASNVEIVYLHSQHNGYGVFKFTDMSVNPDKCKNRNYYVVSKEHNVLFSEIYSLLLTANTTKVKARVYLTGCSPHGHPLISHAMLI